MVFKSLDQLLRLTMFSAQANKLYVKLGRFLKSLPLSRKFYPMTGHLTVSKKKKKLPADSIEPQPAIDFDSVAGYLLFH